MKANKVEVQKGKSLGVGEKTMKTMNHSERVSERKSEMALNRSRVEMTACTPKKSK